MASDRATLLPSPMYANRRPGNEENSSCSPVNFLAREPYNTKPLGNHRPIALAIPRRLKFRPLVELVAVDLDDERSGCDTPALVVAGNDVDQDISPLTIPLRRDDRLGLDHHAAIWE